MIQQISVPEAVRMIEHDKAVVVDIRDQASYLNGHIKGAIRLDNDNFQSFVDSADKSLPVIVCCYHGNSSQAATGVLNSLGFTGYSLQGGMSSWTLANPVEL